VETEYGPGRTDEEANTKRTDESFSTGRKSLAWAEINTENHTKMKISDPNKNTKNTQTQIFQRKSNMVLTPWRSPPSRSLFD
jgi:hypothetical protein